MLTPVETVKMGRIKAMAKAGKGAEVSSSDKQWVLNIMEREQQALPIAVHNAATHQGYCTSFIPIAYAARAY